MPRGSERGLALTGMRLDACHARRHQVISRIWPEPMVEKATLKLLAEMLYFFRELFALAKSDQKDGTNS